MTVNLFNLKSRGTTLRTELLAGATTFLTAAYIIFVQPDILAVTGMDKGALTTITCLSTALATLLVALWANAPLMMAPGMGLNAFFAFSLVIGQKVPWQTALGVVFLSGALFFILTLVGLRERLVKAIPLSLRLATSSGIGLFIAFIGLSNLGLIVKGDAIPLKLGPLSPTVLCGLVGLILALWLENRRIRGAIFLSILATSLLGMLCGLSPWPTALFALPPSPAPLLLQLDILGALTLSLWANILTFMFVDLFDSLGTLIATCREADLTDEEGEIAGLPRLLATDALATMGGALLGTSTTTTYIESASGIAEGGRTGLTALTTATLFLLALFFTPLIAAIPPYATAPALIVVGLFMMRSIGQIDFYRFDEGGPAFLTFILMPLSYSIATGLSFGFISYFLLKLFGGKGREIDPFLIGIAILSLISLIL
ncbi:MAG: guanine permease [Desulfuromonas sp.]|nr:MAG: guanine permease [Desulfuromonas sp.]